MTFKSIVCLTEESVETLSLIKKLELVKGVSIFVKRPKEAMKILKVSQFTNSSVEKIVELGPDLVIGFSDIQKDIARDLIGAGLNVFITNQRSIGEILDYILMLSRLVEAKNEGEELVNNLKTIIENAKLVKLKRKPRIYFEEWDGPYISSIRWVSELIEICGGEDIFSNKSFSSLAKDRIVTPEEIKILNPDIIFACWCGKKVKLDNIRNREGFKEIEAVKKNQLFELAPEIFLQPGPAPILDGIKIMSNIITMWSNSQ